MELTHVNDKDRLLELAQEAVGIVKGKCPKVDSLKATIDWAEEKGLTSYLEELLGTLTPVFVTEEEFKEHLYESGNGNLVFRFLDLDGEDKYLTIVERKYKTKIKFMNEQTEFNVNDLSIIFRHAVMMLNIHFREASNVKQNRKMNEPFKTKARMIFNTKHKLIGRQGK